MWLHLKTRKKLLYKKLFKENKFEKKNIKKKIPLKKINLNFENFTPNILFKKFSFVMR